MGEIIAFGLLFAAATAIFADDLRLRRENRFLWKCLKELKEESKPFYRPQPKSMATGSHAQIEDRPVLNSAAARKRMEQSNAEYFSAERRKTNSEILKEQEKI